MERIIWIAVVGLAFVGCRGTGSDSASLDSGMVEADWQPIITCNDGAVVLDVNTKERQELQFVVHDAVAFEALDQWPYRQLRGNNGERIYQGRSPRGVFSPSDFRHLRKYEVLRDENQQMLGFDIVREGDTVKFRALDLARPGCQPYSSMGDDFYPDSCEFGNYVFRGCQNR